jgi:hypothetical protein
MASTTLIEPTGIVCSAESYDETEANALIRVTRTTWYPDRLRSYEILLDDIRLATVNAGQTADIPVTAGKHLIQLKIDWCGSLPLSFEIEKGETMCFDCRSNIRGVKWAIFPFYIVHQRNQYLELIRT